MSKKPIFHRFRSTFFFSRCLKIKANRSFFHSPIFVAKLLYLAPRGGRLLVLRCLLLLLLQGRWEVSPCRAINTHCVRERKKGICALWAVLLTISFNIKETLKIHPPPIHSLTHSLIHSPNPSIRRREDTVGLGNLKNRIKKYNIF